MIDYNGLRVGAHPIGARLINKQEKHGFVNIPKCASSLLKVATGGRGYQYELGKYEYDANIRFTVLIRDPWERYLSGVAEFIGRNHGFKIGLDEIYTMLFVERKEKKQKIDEAILNQWDLERNNVFMFDEHTVPQAVYIQPFQRNLLEYVKIQRGEPDVLNNYLKGMWGDAPRMPLNVASANKRQLGLSLGEKLMDRTDDWIETWNRLFLEDYVLWMVNGG